MSMLSKTVEGIAVPFFAVVALLSCGGTAGDGASGGRSGPADPNACELGPQGYDAFLSDRNPALSSLSDQDKRLVVTEWNQVWSLGTMARARASETVGGCSSIAGAAGAEPGERGPIENDHSGGAPRAMCDLAVAKLWRTVPKPVVRAPFVRCGLGMGGYRTCTQEAFGRTDAGRCNSPLENDLCFADEISTEAGAPATAKFCSNSMALASFCAAPPRLTFTEALAGSPTAAELATTLERELPFFIRFATGDHRLGALSHPFVGVRKLSPACQAAVEQRAAASAKVFADIVAASEVIVAGAGVVIEK